MLESLFSTLAGKAAATAIAVTASFAGVGAAGALPGPAQSAFDDATSSIGLGGHDEATPAEDLPEPAQEGKATAAAKQDAAQAYSDAVREWTTCVADAAAAHEGSTEPFDPVAACGERPSPHDFGLSDLPSQADGNVPESVPAGPPSGTPSGPPSSTPSGPPSEVPPPPAGRP